MKKRDWVWRLLPAGFLLVFLFCFPQEMTDGIRMGLSLCGTAVIPSLFPFFVVCTFSVRSGLCDSFGRLSARIVRKLFRLPGVAAGVVLLGLCGGFPVGTRMTAQLCENGQLSRNQAQRLCLFCVAAGPAFVVGTIGSELLGSRACGWILFAALTLSNLTVGLLLRFFGSGESVGQKLPHRLSVSQSLCEAVSDGGAGMLPLCAWILLFSGVCTVLERLPNTVYVPLCCVLEVTNGCRIAAENGVSVPVIAAILGFGGLSVHCQILPFVTQCGVKLTHFLTSRVVCGALAAVYCAAILHFFPQAAQTILLPSGQIVEPVRASVPVSAAMLCTAAIFILNTACVPARKS